MFDVGPFELLALAALALFIFGPDKLPKMAADAGRVLRQLREMARGARDEVTSSLGSEFSDLNLSDLDPRAFVKRQLLEEGSELDRAFRDEPATPGAQAKQNGEGASPSGSDGPASKATPSGYDGDAT